MTITLDLTPETETRLIAHAFARGMSVETYLISLIEEHVTIEPKETLHVGSKIPDWETALTKLGQSPSLAKAPPLSDQAISRESIYREREDSQL